MTPWLPLLGGQFTEEHGLEPADLPHLTEADLIAAGLDKPMHRKRVYRHAREECGPGLRRGSAGGSGTAGPALHLRSHGAILAGICSDGHFPPAGTRAAVC